ncbi:MAG: hypothetical protein WDZ52_09110 [Pseudohongiellaceae bacterium]
MSGKADNKTDVGPFDLSVTPIHLDSENPAVPLRNFGFDGPAFACI